MEGCLDALGYINSYANLGFYGRSTQMRGNIKARYPQERMVSRDWLAGKYIHSSSCNLTGENSLPEILLIDDTATGTVNEANALLHLCHDIFIYHVAGGVSKRHMDGDEVGLFYNLIKGAYGYAHILAAFLVDIRIIANDLHVKGQGTLGYAATNTAHAHNTQGLALQLYAGVLFAVPLTLLEGFVGNRNVTSHGHHHGKGMLSGSNSIAPWGIDNNNALVGGSSNINIVYAYTGTADNLQILGSCNNLCSYLGGRAYNQGIVFRDDGEKLLC